MITIITTLHRLELWSNGAMVKYTHTRNKFTRVRCPRKASYTIAYHSRGVRTLNFRRDCHSCHIVRSTLFRKGKQNAFKHDEWATNGIVEDDVTRFSRFTDSHFSYVRIWRGSQSVCRNSDVECICVSKHELKLLWNLDVSKIWPKSNNWFDVNVCLARCNVVGDINYLFLASTLLCIVRP